MNEQVEKIISYLSGKNPSLEAIVLFGSYARGTQNAQSDIDIAIKLRKERIQNQYFKTRARTRGYIKKRSRLN